MEIWKDVKGYEGYYQVSNTGRVKSLERVIILKDRQGNARPSVYKEKLLKQSIEKKDRYNWKDRYYVRLSKNGRSERCYVHRLVAETFIDNPSNKDQINHKDGNPLNNNVNNLEWSSSKENIAHAFSNKLIRTEKPVIQMDKETLQEIREYRSESDACRALGVTQGKVLRAMQRNGTCKGYKWKYK